MEITNWQRAWRNGIAPALSTLQLERLLYGLKSRDKKIIHGAATYPPAHAINAGKQVVAADPIGYALWQADGPKTVVDLDQHINATLIAADANLGEEMGSRHFVWWWDDANQIEDWASLEAEVQRSLEQRKHATECMCTTCID